MSFQTDMRYCIICCFTCRLHLNTPHFQCFRCLQCTCWSRQLESRCCFDCTDCYSSALSPYAWWWQPYTWRQSEGAQIEIALDQQRGNDLSVWLFGDCNHSIRQECCIWMIVQKSTKSSEYMFTCLQCVFLQDTYVETLHSSCCNLFLSVSNEKLESDATP